MNKTYIINEIKKMLDDAVDVKFQKIQKSYGEVEGISITEHDSNVGTVCYYDENDSDDLIVMKVLNVFKNNKPNFDVETIAKNIRNWYWVRDNIFPCLYNKNKGKNIGIVSADVAGDISVMFRIVLPDISKDGQGTIRVTEDMFDEWNVSFNELFNAAKANLNKNLTIVGMNKIMESMIFEAGDKYNTRFIDDDDDIMKVATITSKTNGASVMLLFSDLIDSGEIEDKDYYILPSSIHEIIYLDEYNDAYKDMIKDVNSSVLNPADFLSDNVYIYDHITKEIRVA